MRLRTWLAFGLGMAVLVPIVPLAESAGVGSWGLTGIGFVVMMLISLIDREWFYGVEPRNGVDDARKP